MAFMFATKGRCARFRQAIGFWIDRPHRLCQASRLFSSGLSSDRDVVEQHASTGISTDPVCSNHDTPPAAMMLFNTLTNRVEPVFLSSTTPTPQLNSTTGGTTVKGIACYTCGPTVYAQAHLGHARTYVWMDIMRRVLESQVTLYDSSTNHTPPPLFVLNITDVDDKILQAAAAEASQQQEKEDADRSGLKSPLLLARHYEAEFWQDWDALNCLRPHVVTRVTEYVESDIVPYIQQLIDNGMAYMIDHSNNDNPLKPMQNDHCEVEPGDNNSDYGGVFFDVQAYQEKMGTQGSRYGKMAPIGSESCSCLHIDSAKQAPQVPHDNNGIERIVVVRQAKRDERDFALWKKRKNGEQLYWESPWGLGRPGWHIECSAMIDAAAKQFGDTHTFAIHAGGIDLKFPHHTNEIAQAEAYRWNASHKSHADLSPATSSRDTEWISHWVHTGHLHIDGLKMSKSLKNFVSIRDFLSGDDRLSERPAAGVESGLACPADEFRLWCLGLSGSYRGTAVYSIERLEESRNVRNKIVRFLLQGEERLLRRGEENTPGSIKKWDKEDCEFFDAANRAAAKGRAALASDLDGSTCLEQMVLISDIGRGYLDRQSKVRYGLVEPLSFGIQALRELLTLVGFSQVTTLAGKANKINAIGEIVNMNPRLLMSELTRFRSIIRRAAIDDHKSKEKKPSDNMKLILKLCDQARDEIFPTLGVEFMDAGVDSAEEEDDDWRVCVPRSPVTKQGAVAMNSSIRRAVKSGSIDNAVPSNELFKVGPYAGLFSEYNEDGFPLRTADGAAISNSQNKKLRKTFVKHVTQMERRAMKIEQRSKTNPYRIVNDENDDVTNI